MQNENMFVNSNVIKLDRVIHTPGNFARNNLLFVQEAGHLKSVKPHRCIREGLDSYLIIEVLEGKGVLRIGNEEYSIKKNDIAFIDCTKHYEHISDEEAAWKLGWIHFNGIPAKGYFDLFMQCNGQKQVYSLPDVSKIDQRIKNIIEIQSDPIAKTDRRCAEEILALLNLIIDEFDISEEKKQQDSISLLNNIREYLNKNYNEKNVLEVLREKFLVTTEVAELFIGRYGISIENYIISRKINYAKELLRFSVKPIEEVAIESGLDDSDNLERLFYQYENITPEEYRSKWAGWIRS